MKAQIVHEIKTAMAALISLASFSVSNLDYLEQWLRIVALIVSMIAGLVTIISKLRKKKRLEELNNEPEKVRK